MIKDNSVVYDLVYPSPPERVWRALVRPEELAVWLMPSPGFVPTAGTKFSMSCEPFGDIDGEVLDVVPPRRLVLRWIGTFGDTVVTFELTEHDQGTRLVMRHSGWRDETRASRDQFDSGWHSKLGERLAALLVFPR